MTKKETYVLTEDVSEGVRRVVLNRPDKRNALSNSLRNQYEGWKKSYKEAAKVAETKAKPDFLDMDKDGDKKEPMKKAIADKK